VTGITIAIDGPAGAGKSTVGAAVAAELRYLYFDTGVMYRAVTREAIDRRVAITDEEAVTRLAQELVIQVLAPSENDGRQYTFLADGRDITWGIREPEVTLGVSPVSAYPGVREALTVQQRRIGAPGSVVMVGRDIGTVVLPQALIKIYLDATPEERAQRRLCQDAERGKKSDFSQVLTDIRRRDRIDSTREAAPLRAADDAIIVDSTDMTVDEVVGTIIRVVRDKAPECGL